MTPLMPAPSHFYRAVNTVPICQLQRVHFARQSSDRNSNRIAVKSVGDVVKEVSTETVFMVVLRIDLRSHLSLYLTLWFLSNWITFQCPLWQANSNAVLPFSSCIWMSAPFSSKSCTIDLYPSREVMCSDVICCPSCAFTVAPWSSRSRIISS